MSLPPALLQRLAQRGLVQKQNDAGLTNVVPTENEEVIAEDYDEMENEAIQDAEEEYQYPPLYDNDTTVRKRDDSFWVERMRARMGEGNTYAGYKGCPNKYNIYHKCSLYCVTRWENGHSTPNREYMRRFRRMLRKYPLPNGWTEIFDPGCGIYYFANETDGLVSWLSPSHPKSQISKSAAQIRKQLEENNGEEEESSEGENEDNSDSDSRSVRKAVRRSRSPPAPKLSAQDFPSLHESLNTSSMPVVRKQKSRDLERTISRQRRDRDNEQEHDREHGRERDRGRDRFTKAHRSRAREDSDVLDPMDPSAYSDVPRGKWSDGLQSASEKPKNVEPESSDRNREKSDEDSDHSY